MKTITFEYIFTFSDSKVIHFPIEIDKEKRRIIKTNINTGLKVPWTDLEYYQCVHCPLNKDQSPKCPIAESLFNLVETFKDCSSIEDVDINVIAPERNYYKKTSLQYGLQSIFGILMSASGCPRMEFLSPLVVFHLPFADVEDTIVRLTSIYLLRQFFNKQDGKFADFSMEGLKKQYEEVSNVNQGIIDRIRSIQDRGDATINAITILNTFILFFSHEFKLDLKRYRYLFV